MSHHFSVWELVQGVAKAFPYRKDSVEKLLNATLILKKENEYTHSYVAQHVGTNQWGVTVAGIDLRILKNVPDDPGSLFLDLVDSGITRKDIKQRYPLARLEAARPGPPPQGVSPNASDVYFVQEDWGLLGFGFRVAAPERLDSVIFEPGERDQR